VASDLAPVLRAAQQPVLMIIEDLHRGRSLDTRRHSRGRRLAARPCRRRHHGITRDRSVSHAARRGLKRHRAVVDLAVLGGEAPHARVMVSADPLHQEWYSGNG
jgi:hypothetical protein